jgi:hypothetical protein
MEDICRRVREGKDECRTVSEGMGIGVGGEPKLVLLALAPLLLWTS